MAAIDAFPDITVTNAPLAPHSWFRLGGPAAVLARPHNADQLQRLWAWGKTEKLPIRVLGGGTNVLIRDEGFPGLVIHLESPAFSDVTVSEADATLEAGSAVPLTALCSQAARAGLGGLEILTGIPGTVGGATRGNSGTRHGHIGSLLRTITVLNRDGVVQTLESDELDFQDPAGPGSALADGVILSAKFSLSRSDPEAIVKRLRSIWIDKKEHQPYGHLSSGMIFKNPAPGLLAAAMIEQAGLKGARVGNAEVSDRNANFIVAHPGATARDVLTLIDQIRDAILTLFHQELPLNIQIW